MDKNKTNTNRNDFADEANTEMDKKNANKNK